MPVIVHVLIIYSGDRMKKGMKPYNILLNFFPPEVGRRCYVAIAMELALLVAS